jgi:hypothetical protein
MVPLALSYFEIASLSDQGCSYCGDVTVPCKPLITPTRTRPANGPADGRSNGPMLLATFEIIKALLRPWRAQEPSNPLESYGLGQIRPYSEHLLFSFDPIFPSKPTGPESMAAFGSHFTRLMGPVFFFCFV